MRRSLRAVLTVALALGTRPARADVREMLSVEWSLCDADVALDAEVVSVRPMTAEEHVVTARRRGGARDEVLLRMSPRDAMDYREGARGVIFARVHPGWGHRVTRVIWARGAEAVAQDGTALQGLDAIVARLAAYGPPRRERAVDLPYAPPGQGPDDHTSLRVPANRETELRLRAMLASPAMDQRALGALLIAPFESSANIARLQALLADRERFPGATRPTVCENAAHTLRVWEVPIAADACASPVP